MMPPMPASRLRESLPSAAFALALLRGAAGLALAEPAFQPPPRLAFEQPIADLGEAYQFGAIDHVFQVVNRGERPVRILAAQPVSTAATVRFEPAVLPPGGEGRVSVHQPVGDKLGVATFRIKVTTDDPGGPEQKLALKVFVQSAYDPETALLAFGEVSRHDGARRDFTIGTREAPALRFLGALDAPDWIAVESLGATAEGALKVRVSLKPSAPLGSRQVAFRIRTDLPCQNDFRVELSVAIFEDVVASPAHLDLGLVRIGQEVHPAVRLVRRAGPPLEIERIEGALPGMTPEAGPCTGTAAGAGDSCREISVRYSPKELGNQTGVLLVHLAGRSEPIPISYAVLAVAENAQVRDVASMIANGEVALPFLPPPGAPKPVESAPSEPSKKRAVSIRWKATKEDPVYGYLIYRAERREGPFLRLSREVVKVTDRSAPANEYRYVDTTAEPGKTYYYYLDSVSLSGIKRRFSGVLARTIAPDAQ